MIDYLPRWATPGEAQAWLEAATNEAWPLPRIVEGARMYVLLDPPPGLRRDDPVMTRVFEGRREGRMAEIVFGGDAARIAAARTVSVSMTRTPSGELVELHPPLLLAIDELRFAADDLRALRGLPAPTPVNGSTKRWTPEALAEILAYHGEHGTKDTAARFKISKSLVRQLVGKAKQEQASLGSVFSTPGKAGKSSRKA